VGQAKKLSQFCSAAIVAPQEAKVGQLTPVSAQINWYPSNSNCEHIILLNGIKVCFARTLRRTFVNEIKRNS